jgi:hygromycin-B 7''-O-kinase
MALMLLHRFGNPTRQICIEGWQQTADLHELQDLLWPI